jgi:hypothetical protein
MIVRILGYGQYRVPDEAVADVDAADERIEAAVEGGDARGFAHALTELVEVIQSSGTLLGPGEFARSEAVVPAPGTTLEEAGALLSSEGLIPEPGGAGSG